MHPGLGVVVGRGAGSGSERQERNFMRGEGSEMEGRRVASEMRDGGREMLESRLST
jgi:hypothetical protein